MQYVAPTIQHIEASTVNCTLFSNNVLEKERTTYFARNLSELKGYQPNVKFPNFSLNQIERDTFRSVAPLSSEGHFTWPVSMEVVELADWVLHCRHFFRQSCTSAVYLAEVFCDFQGHYVWISATVLQQGLEYLETYKDPRESPVWARLIKICGSPPLLLISRTRHPPDWASVLSTSPAKDQEITQSAEFWWNYVYARAHTVVVTRSTLLGGGANPATSLPPYFLKWEKRFWVGRSGRDIHSNGICDGLMMLETLWRIRVQKRQRWLFDPPRITAEY